MSTFITALLAAVLPTLFLVWIIWWADRYEREPTKLLVAAFFWGTLPAILLALIAELTLRFPSQIHPLGSELVNAGFIAPVVEETVKGLALMGLLLFQRPEIDDILDGIIYGALVGAGFAMTENFFYFLGTDNQAQLHTLIFLRAGIFGLNHIFFTAVFGASMGWAAQLTSRASQGMVLILGLGIAISLHMMHNISTVLTQFSPVYLAISTSLLWLGLLLFFVFILFLLARERRIIQAYLQRDEAQTIPAQTQARLMATLPPVERLLPTALLPADARHRARLYQTVAELAFRWHRLPKARGPRAEQIQQDIVRLQHDLDTLTS